MPDGGSCVLSEPWVSDWTFFNIAQFDRNLRDDETDLFSTSDQGEWPSPNSKWRRNEGVCRDEDGCLALLIGDSELLARVSNLNHTSFEHQPPENIQNIHIEVHLPSPENSALHVRDRESRFSSARCFSSLLNNRRSSSGELATASSPSTNSWPLADDLQSRTEPKATEMPDVVKQGVLKTCREATHKTDTHEAFLEPRDDRVAQEVEKHVGQESEPRQACEQGDDHSRRANGEAFNQIKIGLDKQASYSRTPKVFAWVPPLPRQSSSKNLNCLRRSHRVRDLRSLFGMGSQESLQQCLQDDGVEHLPLMKDDCLSPSSLSDLTPTSPSIFTNNPLSTSSSPLLSSPVEVPWEVHRTDVPMTLQQGLALGVSPSTLFDLYPYSEALHHDLHGKAPVARGLGRGQAQGLAPRKGKEAWQPLKTVPSQSQSHPVVSSRPSQSSFRTFVEKENGREQELAQNVEVEFPTSSSGFYYQGAFDFDFGFDFPGSGI